MAKFRLKDFRQAHGLFQSDMSELLQTNQSSVSRMELKPSVKLTFPQMQRLKERYGEEEVEAFMEDDSISIDATGNTNEGNGTQNNGYFGMDASAMRLIREQSEALMRLSAKQSEQTDKLLALIEKLSEKL